MNVQKMKEKRPSGFVNRPTSHLPFEKRTEPCDYYEAAKLGELVPGIIHNLSTPLSGVLGGVQLLEMRSLSIAETLEKLDDHSDDIKQELSEHLKRHQKSVDLISRNTQNLSNLLQNLSTRLTRFSIKTPDIYGLNQLIEMELRYLEFHLNFKHRVRRRLTLGKDLPPLRCVFSHFARGVDEIIYTAMGQHDSQKESLLEIDVITMAEPDQLVLRLNCSIDYARFDEMLSSPIESHGTMLPYYIHQLQEDNWDVEMRPSELGTEFLLKHPPIHLASHR